MREYREYVRSLRGLVESNTLDETLVACALDGQPGRELRRVVSIDTLRDRGAFFTGRDLAKLAAAPLAASLSATSVVLDPTVGAGDLLLALSHHLPIRRTVESTLRSWGKHLMGWDLVPEFVQATRIRLALAAIQRGASHVRPRRLALAQLLPGIRCGNALRERAAYRRASHVIMNPPYSIMKTTASNPWRSGQVSAAAVLVNRCLEHVRAGTRISAILPEVLRTGTSYEAWRGQIELMAHVVRTESHGRFSAECDVDVLNLSLIAGGVSSAAPAPNWGMPRARPHTVGNHFIVNVGTVVPHRHPATGPEYAFIHARSVPRWAIISRIRERRRFAGHVHIPPFVVIRRTSRPGDPHRAAASIISGKRPVAVENHLLVASPKRGGIAKCKALLTLLRQEQTSEWLDRAMRCRHLTVSSLSRLPWGSEEL